MSNTAIRRFNDRRMKKRAISKGMDIKYADHLCACSRMCCGHRRKWNGPPVSDLRQFEITC